jgi:hypothetical protein
MKKAIVSVVLLMASVSSFAGFKDDPTESFWIEGLQTTKTTVKWEIVEDASTRCQQESKKYTTMHQIGHEVRHCFQGNFH